MESVNTSRRGVGVTDGKAVSIISEPIYHWKNAGGVFNFKDLGKINMAPDTSESLKNLCKRGDLLATCTAGKKQADQKGCRFYRKASKHNRCMHFRKLDDHNGFYHCDNVKAQQAPYLSKD